MRKEIDAMTVNEAFDRDVTFEITEPIGVLATYSTGWSKEINIVKWNGSTPKYDIRDWDPAHERMSRGVTLHEKEMRLMIDLIRRRGSGRIRAAAEETGVESEEEKVMKTIAEPSEQAGDKVPKEPEASEDDGK